VRRLPVLAVIRESYAFTFGHLGAIIGLIWLPMVIATVGDFFVTQHYGRQVSQAMAAGNPGAAGPAVLIQLGFFLVRLLLYAVMYVPVAQLALGQRQGGVVAHFAFGAREWRMFRALLGLTVLFFISVMALTVLAAGAGAVTPQSLLSEVAGLLFLFGIVYVGLRMGFLVPAIVVAEEGPALTRAWIVSAGNFWRLFAVLLGALGPLLLLLGLVLLMLIYGSLDTSKPPTMEAVSAAASANLPLTMGAQFLVAPLLIGLFAGASVFSWRALSQNGARADISA
jgi:hypothetical protein